MSSAKFSVRGLLWLLVAQVLWATPATAASENILNALTPASAFVQAGVAEENTQAYVLGGTWDWPWQAQYSFATLSGYFEAAFGRWVTHDGGVTGSTWATQVGITPVIRFQPNGQANRWFGEIGIGANFILPIYRSREKRFSTEFNFGDHIAIGRQFGEQRRYELALRLEHFSNGGIDHPNPGENFAQLRLSRKF